MQWPVGQSFSHDGLAAGFPLLGLLSFNVLLNTQLGASSAIDFAQA
jgi:hypothetical protein